MGTKTLTSGIYKVEWIKYIAGQRKDVTWYAFSYDKLKDNIKTKHVFIFPYLDDPVIIPSIIGDTYSGYMHKHAIQDLKVVDGPYPTKKFKNFIIPYNKKYTDHDLFELLNIPR